MFNESYFKCAIRNGCKGQNRGLRQFFICADGAACPRHNMLADYKDTALDNQINDTRRRRIGGVRVRRAPPPPPPVEEKEREVKQQRRRYKYTSIPNFKKKEDRDNWLKFRKNEYLNYIKDEQNKSKEKPFESYTETVKLADDLQKFENKYYEMSNDINKTPEFKTLDDMEKYIDNYKKERTRLIKGLGRIPKTDTKDFLNEMFDVLHSFISLTNIIPKILRKNKAIRS